MPRTSDDLRRPSRRPSCLPRKLAQWSRLSDIRDEAILAHIEECFVEKNRTVPFHIGECYTSEAPRPGPHETVVYVTRYGAIALAPVRDVDRFSIREKGGAEAYDSWPAPGSWVIHVFHVLNRFRDDFSDHKEVELARALFEGFSFAKMAVRLRAPSPRVMRALHGVGFQPSDYTSSCGKRGFRCVGLPDILSREDLAQFYHGQLITPAMYYTMGQCVVFFENGNERMGWRIYKTGTPYEMHYTPAESRLQ